MRELQRKGNTSSYFPVIICEDVVCKDPFVSWQTLFSVLERIEWLYYRQDKPRKV